MNRAKRILSRGWLGNAFFALTFGYYPAQTTPTGVPIVTIEFAFVKRSMAFALAQRGMAFTLAQRSMGFALTQRSTSFALAQRSVDFEFIGNEPG